VQEDLSVGPLIELCRDSRRQTCKLSLIWSESATGDGLHLASRTAQAALPTNVWTLLLPRSILRAASSILTSKVRRAKRWNNGKSGAGHYTGLLNVDASPV
jgi:hypothetical protein